MQLQPLASRGCCSRPPHRCSCLLFAFSNFLEHSPSHYSIISTHVCVLFMEGVCLQSGPFFPSHSGLRNRWAASKEALRTPGGSTTGAERISPGDWQFLNSLFSLCRTGTEVNTWRNTLYSLEDVKDIKFSLLTRLSTVAHLQWHFLAVHCCHKSCLNMSVVVPVFITKCCGW